MRVYTVHLDPLSVADDRGAVLVREGFSWGAALFTVFWALYRRLWGWAAVLLAADAALGLGVAWLGIDRPGETAVVVGYRVLVGCHANDWRRAGLGRRGRVFADIVAARNAGGAERRFFDRGAWRAA
ncbi:MAG: DUF2628 domain-containing protein [Alphaproteobacteria bacterium]